MDDDDWIIMKKEDSRFPFYFGHTEATLHVIAHLRQAMTFKSKAEAEIRMVNKNMGGYRAVQVRDAKIEMIAAEIRDG